MVPRRPNIELSDDRDFEVFAQSKVLGGRKGDGICSLWENARLFSSFWGGRAANSSVESE